MILTFTTTKPGFLVIVANMDEVSKRLDRFAICDHCRQESGMGYYIAILRLWYCKECYEEWSRIATIRFRGVIPAEERNYREMIDRLKPK